mgnify:CR=1 FL=1
MTIFMMIFDRLYLAYGPQGWWPADTPFEMMVGAILVQRTNWNNAEKAMQRLKPWLDPERLETLTVEQLAEIIRPSGFYNVKARRIFSLLQWFKTYDYKLENVKVREGRALREELLQIKGIGRETADCILVYALKKPFFIVDAYTRRIFYRFGLDMPASYDEFQRKIKKHIPEDVKLYNEYHALLVEHGKRHCRKIPICVHCPLEDLCLKRLE